MKQVLTLLLVSILLCGSWLIRNGLRGEWVFTSNGSDYIEDQLFEVWRAEGIPLNEMLQRRTEGRRDFQPWAAVKAFGLSMGNLFLSGGTGNLARLLGIETPNQERLTGYLSGLWSVYGVLVFSLAGIAFMLRIYGLVGLYRLWHDDRQMAVLILLIIAGLTIQYGFLGQSRFRVPLEPFLGILTAYSLRA